jgi:putative transposase
MEGGFSPGMNKRAPQEERTFFVTSVTYGRRQAFRRESWANLFVEVCQENRRKGRFLLHEFVLMPNHFHMLLTPAPEVSLEKAMQYIKGGFSFRVKKELQSNLEVWQPSFTEHRIQDWSDYSHHCEYIRQNPVRARLVVQAADYPYGSASGRFELDGAPPWLKPPHSGEAVAGLKPRASTDSDASTDSGPSTDRGASGDSLTSTDSCASNEPHTEPRGS